MPGFGRVRGRRGKERRGREGTGREGCIFERRMEEREERRVKGREGEKGRSGGNCLFIYLPIYKPFYQSN